MPATGDFSRSAGETSRGVRASLVAEDTPVKAFPSILLCAAALAASLPARAGLTGQPAPPSAVARAVRAAASEAVSGDAAAARSDLQLAVERAPETDLTDLVEPALIDAPCYNGVAGVLQEALAAAADRDKTAYLLYNLARVHLLRARKLGPSYRAAPLAAGSSVAARFDLKRTDPALWELAGEIESERGDAEAAQKFYLKMGNSPAVRALTFYRIGVAYERKFDDLKAEKSYLDGIRADGGTGKKLRHNLYQNLAALYLAKGRDREAEGALAQSAKVTQDDDAPFRMRLDAVRKFFPSRRFKAAADYLRVVIRFQPDDADARKLLSAASAGRMPQ